MRKHLIAAVLTAILSTSFATASPSGGFSPSTPEYRLIIPMTWQADLHSERVVNIEHFIELGRRYALANKSREAYLSYLNARILAGDDADSDWLRKVVMPHVRATVHALLKNDHTQEALKVAELFPLKCTDARCGEVASLLIQQTYLEQAFSLYYESAPEIQQQMAGEMMRAIVGSAIDPHDQMTSIAKLMGTTPFDQPVYQTLQQRFSFHELLELLDMGADESLTTLLLKAVEANGDYPELRMTVVGKLLFLAENDRVEPERMTNALIDMVKMLSSAPWRADYRIALQRAVNYLLDVQERDVRTKGIANILVHLAQSGASSDEKLLLLDSILTHLDGTETEVFTAVVNGYEQLPLNSATYQRVSRRILHIAHTPEQFLAGYRMLSVHTDKKTAEQHIAAHSNNRVRNTAFRELVKILVERKDIHGAFAIVRQMTEPDLQVDALTILARETARTVSVKQAVKYSEELGVEKSRFDALLGISSGF